MSTVTALPSDVLEARLARLPGSFKKFEKLVERREVSATRQRGAVETIHEARRDLGDTRFDLENLRRHFERANPRPGDWEQQLARAEARVERARDRLRKAQDYVQALTIASTIAADHADRCERLIAGRKADGLAEFGPVTIPKGATVETLVGIRVQRLDERKAVAGAPLDLASRELQVDALVARLAKPPRLTGHSRQDRLGIQWPRLANGDVDVNAVVGWLAADRLAAELKGQLHGFFEGYEGLALSVADRERRLRELDEEVLILERQICQFTWAAIEQGDDAIDFPRGVSARALLALA